MAAALTPCEKNNEGERPEILEGWPYTIEVILMSYTASVVSRKLRALAGIEWSSPAATAGACITLSSGNNCGAGGNGMLYLSGLAAGPRLWGPTESISLRRQSAPIFS